MKVKKGMYWHEYHLGLISYCFDYDARWQNILAYKPKREIESRIKWFQPVKGKLPDAVVKAAKILTKIKAAYDKADSPRTWNAWNGARAAFNRAIADNKSTIEKLHKKECPNCTWDGERLVF